MEKTPRIGHWCIAFSSKGASKMKGCRLNYILKKSLWKWILCRNVMNLKRDEGVYGGGRQGRIRCRGLFTDSIFLLHHYYYYLVEEIWPLTFNSHLQLIQLYLLLTNKGVMFFDLKISQWRAPTYPQFKCLLSNLYFEWLI